TRQYSILAYEYAVQGLRYGAGAAVVLTVAPMLFLLILFLGRYMMRRADVADVEEAGPVWRAAMALVWPFRLALGGVVAIFWALNAFAQSVAGSGSRAFGRRSAGPLLSRRTGRGVGALLMYLGLGAVLLFELFPFYFIFVTAFKSTLQIQQIRNLFWPDPWTLDQFRYLFTQVPFTNWYANTVMVTAVSTGVSIVVGSLGAYALVRLKWRGSNPLGTAVLIAYLMPAVLM